MERILTKNVGRWEAGLVRDWPRTTWNNLAKQLGKNKRMEDITRPAHEVAEESVKDSGQQKSSGQKTKGAS